MDIAERLAAAMAAKSISQYRLAEVSGVPQPTIQRILSRETRNPKSATMRPLAEALGITLDELITGDAPMASVAEPRQAYASDSAFRHIPVVGIAQLGDEGYWEEFQFPVGHGDGAIRWQSEDPGAYALEVRGDSMEPRIRHGEFVIVEPARKPEHGDEVLVVTADGRCMVKVLAYRKQGRVYLNSVNRSHPEISLDEAAQVVKMHYVAGIAKAALHIRQGDEAARKSETAKKVDEALKSLPPRF